MIFTKKKNKTIEATSSIDSEIVEMVDIAVNKIAPRYPGEVYIYIADHYSKIDFEDYDEMYSDTFRAIVTNSSVSAALDYNFALRFFNISEDQASLIRNAGRAENGCWRIIVPRRINHDTISKISTIISNHCEKVCIDAYRSEEKQVSVRCKPS